MPFRIVKGKPPIYDEIVNKIGTPPANAVFAYGDTIYTPDGTLSMELVAHEHVHLKNQKAHEGGAAGWWAKYLDDAAFRTKEELQAYRAQYRFVCVLHKDRNDQARACFYMAQALAGEMYGKLMPLTQAIKLIRQVTTFN